jgi:hypothetical protein
MMKRRGNMNIFITNIYAIFLAVIYTSTVSAMPLQIDFSTPWRASQSLLQFGFSEKESITLPSSIKSDAVKKIAGTEALLSYYYTDMADILLFSASDLHLSGARYGSKLELVEGISTIGYSSANMLLPAMLRIKRELKHKLSSDFIDLIDEKGGLSLNVLLYSADAGFEIATGSSVESAESTATSFFFLSAMQLHSQTVPDPSPLWLVGLVVGLTGLTWSLLNLVRTA